MTSRERRVARAAWLMERDLSEAADALREARLRAGLTLRYVGTAAGTSASAILRTERRIPPGPRAKELAMHAAAVGLRARIKLYRDGPALRDGPQLELIRAFRNRIQPGMRLEVEVPVITSPGSGDARAFDALLDLLGGRCAVEFYTRFHDCQAQLRSALLKQRDAGVERLVVVVRATRHNRRAVGMAADLVAASLPLGTRAVLAALHAGRDPGANGLVLL